MFSREINFTQGSIIQSVVSFSIPLVLGELLQNLYSSMDALVVGNFVSESALAAVTVCSVIAVMIINFFNAMSVGANVVVSRSFGTGDFLDLRRTIQITFTFSTILGIVLSIAGIFLAPELLSLADAQAEYYADALAYLRIYLAGLMFTVIYNNGAGILRAIGASAEAFRILAVACATNIALDLFFTLVIPLEIVGVGVATVIAQLFSSLLVYRAISKHIETSSINFHTLLHGADIIRAAMGIGVSSGIQSAMIGISNLLVVRYMNVFDTLTVAGIGIGQKLERFVIMPARSFGITMTTFVSQNLGAKKYDRVAEGMRKVICFGLGITVFLSICAYAFAHLFARLFSADAQVISIAVSMICVLSPCFFSVCLREMFNGYLRGHGISLVPTVLNVLGMVCVRQIYLYFSMRSEPAVEYIYRCFPIAWFATIFFIFAYYLCVRKKLRPIDNSKSETTLSHR